LGADPNQKFPSKSPSAKIELIPVFLRKKSEENTFKPSENLFAKKTI
jgi:hypothetical protein